MRTLVLSLLALLATTVALLSNGAPVSAEPTDKEKSELAAKVYTLLKDKCVSCHDEKANAGWKKTIKDILNHEKLMGQGVINPEKPEESKLYEELNEGEMPRELAEDGKTAVGKKLPQADIDLVLNWIKAGAPKWEAAKADEKLPAQVAWKELKVSGPNAGNGVQMCEGPNRTIVGLASSADLTKHDTWVFVDGAWTKKLPENSPFVVAPEGMVFDKQRNVTILFSLSIDENQIDEWDGTNWRSINTENGPWKRQSMSLAFDAVNNVVLLFGGRIWGRHSGNASFDPHYADTWTFDGKTWKKLELKEGPSARDGAAMCWSPSNNGVLLFGGQGKGDNFGDTKKLNDTWLFDGKGWKELKPATVPPGSASARMVASTKGIVCVTPGDDAMQTWVWDGKDWQKAPCSIPARECFALAFDGKSKGIVLFGGIHQKTPKSDTWVLNGAK